MRAVWLLISALYAQASKNRRNRTPGRLDSLLVLNTFLLPADQTIVE